MQPLQAYILTQGVICAIINMVVNPSLAWLTNRTMEFVPLREGIVVDTTITSLVLPLLVTLFTAAGVRRDLKTGRVKAPEGLPRAGNLLPHLPGNVWALGLTLGFGAVLVILPLTLGLFHLLGLPGLSFAGFALFKAIYTGMLAFLVTRWVILRQFVTNKSSLRSTQS
jgi:hypothetical protein